MWSSGVDDINNRVSSSSSKSSSSSSSHSPFSTPTILPNSRRKTMEEVWKDINLTSLSRGVEIGGQPFPNPNSNRNSFRGIHLQEFLAKPFDKENPPPPISVATTNSTAGDDVIHNIFGSTPTSTPTQVCPPPPTVLSLNTVPEFQPEFHYLDNNDPVLRSNPRLDNHCNGDLGSSFVSSFNSPFDPFAAASSLSPFCKKRASDSDENTGGDRRHKRMIKNRESAARSRARKQETLSLSFSLSKEFRVYSNSRFLFSCIVEKMPRFDDRHGSTRLYVGRLSSRTRSRDLEDLFSRYGRFLGFCQTWRSMVR